MKFFLGLFILTFLSSNVFAIELTSNDYGFKIGNNKYFQVDGSGVYLSDNGKLKKLDVEVGMLVQIFKLKDEYIVISIGNQYNGSPIISSISNDLKTKKINVDLSNIPDFLINGSLDCETSEKLNKLYFSCSNSVKSNTIYKYIYNNGKFSSINKIDNRQVTADHCLREYKFYKDLRLKKPKYGYSINDMSLSITRELYFRLKNVDEIKYAQILNSRVQLTSQQFKVKYCP